MSVLCVCMCVCVRARARAQGVLACDLEKTQQAGAMMQPVTADLSPFYLENTSHLPPNSFRAPLT